VLHDAWLGLGFGVLHDAWLGLGLGLGWCLGLGCCTTPLAMTVAVSTARPSAETLYQRTRTTPVHVKTISSEVSITALCTRSSALRVCFI